ncbi:hypothetical protein HGRIS_011500 [Hohenbuehelia grisea]|uniref:Uncharacterized protein n=1 Tax=Hohenbuehelia grisea TaxID=104357 RepID=A0ABR3JVF7_9AGAR
MAFAQGTSQSANLWPTRNRIKITRTPLTPLYQPRMPTPEPEPYEPQFPIPDIWHSLFADKPQPEIVTSPSQEMLAQLPQQPTPPDTPILEPENYPASFGSLPQFSYSDLEALLGPPLSCDDLSGWSELDEFLSAPPPTANDPSEEEDPYAALMSMLNAGGTCPEVSSSIGCDFDDQPLPGLELLSPSELAELQALTLPEIQAELAKMCADFDPSILDGYGFGQLDDAVSATDDAYDSAMAMEEAEVELSLIEPEDVDMNVDSE